MQEMTLINPDIWENIKKVFYAVSQDASYPVLQYVRFGPGFVEARDTARAARVDVDLSWDGLVLGGLFKSWPRNSKVVFGFSSVHLCVWIDGEELRVSPWVDSANYPTINPSSELAFSAVVTTHVLQQAVKQGSALSSLGLVLLDCQQAGLNVRAWRETKQQDERFDGFVRLHEGDVPEKGVLMLLHGKYLQEALKSVETPTVVLRFGRLEEPLQIESGKYTALVWQMIYE